MQVSALTHTEVTLCYNIRHYLNPTSSIYFLSLKEVWTRITLIFKVICTLRTATVFAIYWQVKHLNFTETTALLLFS